MGVADRRESVHALPTVVHVPKPSTTKRTSFLDKTSNNPNDFMSNISSNLPQWPEPEAQWPETEETLGQPPSESDPFIRHHHSTFDPQGVVHVQRSRNREKGSKESISSLVQLVQWPAWY